MNKRVTALWILGVLIIILTGFSAITEITIAKEKNYGWNNNIYLRSDFSGQFVRSIAVDKDHRIWIGLGNNCRIYRYENGKWTDLNLSDIVQSACEFESINYITFDSMGRAWIGTERNGLILIDGESIKSFNTINSDIPRNNIGWIAISPKNTAWTESNSVQAILLFDGDEWIPVIISRSTEDNVAVDNMGRLWVLATYGGLIRYDDDGRTEYTPENSGLESIYLSTIAFDPEGRAWIGWNKNNAVGINVFDGKNWESISPIGILEPESEYDDNRATEITFDLQGRIWIGTSGGLKVYDGENWLEYTSKNSGLSDNAITQLLVDNEDNVWIGTLEGLNVISSQLPTPLPAGKQRLYSSIFVWHNFWGISILLTGVWFFILFQGKLRKIKININKRTRNWSVFLVLITSIMFGSGIDYLTSMYPGPSVADFFVAPFKGLHFVMTDSLAFMLVLMGTPITLIALMICLGLGASIGGKKGNSLKGSIIGIWLSIIPGILITFWMLQGWN